MTVMLAARAHPGASSLQLDKIDLPKPGPHDVLIKVASAGLGAWVGNGLLGSTAQRSGSEALMC